MGLILSIIAAGRSEGEKGFPVSPGPGVAVRIAEEGASGSTRTVHARPPVAVHPLGTFPPRETCPKNLLSGCAFLRVSSKLADSLGDRSILNSPTERPYSSDVLRIDCGTVILQWDGQSPGCGSEGLVEGVAHLSEGGGARRSGR